MFEKGFPIEVLAQFKALFAIVLHHVFTISPKKSLADTLLLTESLTVSKQSPKKKGKKTLK